MEGDIAFDAVDVGRLGADGVGFEADGVTSAGSVPARTWSSSFLGVGSIGFLRLDLTFSGACCNISPTITLSFLLPHAEAAPVASSSTSQPP
jgi:hypothetical protein